jgi:hypothetical protein
MLFFSWKTVYVITQVLWGSDDHIAFRTTWLMYLSSILVFLKTRKSNAVFQKMDSLPSPDKKSGVTHTQWGPKEILCSPVIYRLRTTLFLKSQAE